MAVGGCDECSVGKNLHAGIRAVGAFEIFLQVDAILARPFFARTLDFPLYTKGPGTRRVSFGDDSTMGDLPSLKVGYNVPPGFGM